MADITLRSEKVTTNDFFIAKTITGSNRIFSQGKGLTKTLMTMVGVSGSGKGSTASFYTQAASGQGQVITESRQSSSGDIVPTTTIESVQEAQ